MRGKSVCVWASAALIVLGAVGSAQAAKKYTVAYVEIVMNDWTQAYWEAGKAKAESLGMEAINLDPNNDVQKQIDLVKSAIAKKVDLILIQPVDSVSLKPVLLEAAGKGIIVYDHFAPDPSVGLKHDNIKFATFGQAEAGEMAGKGMIQALGGKGKVAIITGTAGADNARLRSEGFKKAIAGTGIQVVAEIAADWDRAKAMSVAEDLLTKYPDLAGIYSHDDGMAIGICEAIKQAGKSGQIAVTSCSGNEGGIMRIKSGEMYSTSDVPTKWFAEAPVQAFYDWKTNKTPLKDLVYQPVMITKANADSWLEKIKGGW